MRKTSFVVVAALAPLIIGTAGILAQGTSRAGSGNPISQSVRQQWNTAKKNIVDSAALMPEPDYGFRPVPTVRTFGEILKHVTGANYEICAPAKGEKPPFAEDYFEKTELNKAAIVKALDDSMAYCDGQFTALDDKSAAALITMPFKMGKAARVAALTMNTGHLNEHYGNLVTYFRIKGMVPPSSRQP